MPLAALMAVVTALTVGVQVPAPQPAAPPDPPCRLTGALVDEAGRALAGVTLDVHGFQANSERVRRFGVPRGWQDPAPVTTGADGRFSLSFVPPRAYQFTLDASAPGLGRLGWRWSALEPGQELDLGTTTLEPEAVLVGHIVDARGNLQVEGWTVSAWHNWSAGVGGRSTSSARSVVDPATGQFRIEGLPAGALRVDAGKGSTRIESVNVTTKKGEETFVELRYIGPDPAQRLVVAIGTRPFYGFRPAPGTVHAVAEDGTRHALTPAPGRANDWHVVGIAPGSYRVEVRDLRFVEWTNEAVRTGESVSVHLVGSAVLRVAVVDGATGARVEDYSLDVGYRGVNFSPSVFRVRERADSPPAGGVYAGIVPGDLTLEVQAAGWPLARATVDALAPGETREVSLTLVRGAPLRGRVVDNSGQPLAGVEVQVKRGEFPGHDLPGAGGGHTSGMVNGKQVTIPSRYRDAAATTGEDGSFTFGSLGPGTHALLATRGPWNDVWTTVELPRDEPVVLALPDAVLTSVRLRLPEGEAHTDLSLQLERAHAERMDPVRQAWTMGGWDEPWTAGADGMYPARYLPLGTHSLQILRATEDGPFRGHDVLTSHEVTLVGPGPEDLELDLRESYPVGVSFLFWPKPPVAPAEDWSFRVVLTRDGQLVPGVHRGRSEPFRLTSAPLVGSNAVAPGSYHVEIHSAGVRWIRPEPVNIVRGADNAFTLDVPLVSREVRVVDADGAALVNSTVAYWTDPAVRASGTTNADGALVVVLLEGTLSLAVPPPPPVKPDDGPGDGLRRRAIGAGATPRIDPQVLSSLTARVTAPFGPGEGPLELRLGPE